MMSSVSSLSDIDLVNAVKDAYSAKARLGTGAPYARNVAEAFGYTPEQLETVPAETILGLSCGNPVATATLKEGETVLDLGSGGGIDVFLAASKVGPSGQAIGIDISPEMVELARKNAERQDLKPQNVSFVQASLTEPLPIVDVSVDCVLSNCVINLLPFSGKKALLKEVYRILKPGGRVVLDDLLAKKPLPSEIMNNLASYIDCIAGAVLVDQYKELLGDAGFGDAVFVETKHDLNIYYESESSCCSGASPLSPKPNYDVNEWIASYQIYIVKPKTSPEEVKHLETALLRWWDAYPTIKSTPALITPEDLAALVRSAKGPQSDFAIIDVRRNDHAGGHIRGSDNCFAQTFCNDLPEFLEKYGNTKQVVFYCGSSSGRGPRCAGWYQDYLNDSGTESSEAFVLQGGVKAWLAKYGNEESLVDRDL